MADIETHLWHWVRRVMRSQILHETRCRKYNQVNNFCLTDIMGYEMESKTPPLVFKDAWDHEDPESRENWRESIGKEVKYLTDRNVWDVVENKGQRYIPLKWVFHRKDDGRHRDILVALGYRQIQGLDFEYMHSPVISDIGFRMIINISLKKVEIDQS